MRNWTRTLRTDRRAFIGGSDARIIMDSDGAALLRLWREKRGEAEPQDLSGNLIVQLGAERSQIVQLFQCALIKAGPFIH